MKLTIVLVICVLLIILGLGIYLFSTRVARPISKVDNSVVSQANFIVSPTPAPTKAVPGISPIPSSASMDCNCSWTISTVSNVELLVTSPRGQQTGYLASSKYPLLNISNSSYGVQPGIAAMNSQTTPMPAENYFGVSEAETGIYKLQVIGKQSGKYVLDVRIARISSTGKVATISGTIAANQIDQYNVDIPVGTIQKVNK